MLKLQTSKKCHNIFKWMRTFSRILQIQNGSLITGGMETLYLRVTTPELVHFVIGRERSHDLWLQIGGLLSNLDCTKVRDRFNKIVPNNLLHF